MRLDAIPCVLLGSLLVTGCSRPKGGKAEEESAVLRRAAERAERLSKEIGKIEFDVAFHGLEYGAPYHLALWVPPLPKRSGPSPTNPMRQITGAQAEAIVKWLREEGFLVSARDLIGQHPGRRVCIDPKPPRGPAVTLGVRGPKHLELYDILAWRRPELERLDRLEKALGGKAGKAVGAFAQWVRKEWSVEEVKRDKRIAVLVAELEDNDARARENAASRLGEYGPMAAGAVPALIQALEDKDTEVRVHAACTLPQLGPASRQAVPALLRALKDREASGRSRSYVAYALGKIGTAADEVVPALITALRDKDVGVRNYAALALGLIGGRARTAIPTLKEALKDENEHVRNAAAEALKKISTEQP